MKIILLIGLFLYIFIGVLLYFFQDKLIFLGEPLESMYRFEFDTPFQEHNLTMKDGANINVLHFKSDLPKGLIVYFHGNAGNLARWGHVAEYYVGLGYDVAIMDYRGYGKSTGKRTQATLLSDAQAVYDFFKDHIGEDKIVLYGRSIGSGIAAHVAANNKPGKLILETPYYNFESLAWHYFPIFPIGLALRYQFPSNAYLQKVNCPVFIFHGTEDNVIPIQQGQKLFQETSKGNGNVTFFRIEGGGHNNLIEFKEFQTRMQEVLR